MQAWDAQNLLSIVTPGVVDASTRSVQIGDMQQLEAEGGRRGR